MCCKSGFAPFLCLISLAFLLSSCKREQRRTLQSPIQAVTTLLRTADGTVEAELVLISTEKPIHEFVQAHRCSPADAGR